jgi:hypothetical protein
MGGFYGNITLKGTTQARAASALRGRRAAVAANVGDLVAVFDAACDDQDTDAIQALALRLSGDCTALAVVVHDDDILFYLCCRAGEVVDRYDSAPNYFKRTQASSAPLGGNAQVLCALFDAADGDAVHAILHERRYASQTDRHRDLARELRLPVFTVGTALASLDRGEYPDGMSAETVVRAADPPPVESLQTRWDRRFYESLGPPRTDRICQREGCGRGAVPSSVFCKRHHFEMVRGYPCPFAEE